MKYSVQEFKNDETGESFIALVLSTDALVTMLRKEGGIVLHLLDSDAPPFAIVAADSQDELIEQINSIIEQHIEHMKAFAVPKEMLNG